MADLLLSFYHEEARLVRAQRLLAQVKRAFSGQQISPWPKNRKHRQEGLCGKIADLEKGKKKDWRSRRAVPVLHEVLLDLGEIFGSSFLLLRCSSFLS